MAAATKTPVTMSEKRLGGQQTNRSASLTTIQRLTGLPGSPSITAWSNDRSHHHTGNQRDNVAVQPLRIGDTEIGFYGFR
jgi:hypothetical protein